MGSEAVTFARVPMRRGRVRARHGEMLAAVLALEPGSQPLLFPFASLVEAQKAQRDLQRLTRWRGVTIKTRTGPLGLYVWQPRLER